MHNKWEQLNQTRSHDSVCSNFWWYIYFITYWNINSNTSVYIYILYTTAYSRYRIIIVIHLVYKTCTMQRVNNKLLGCPNFRNIYNVQESKKIYIIIMCGRYIWQWLLCRGYTACNNIIIKWPGEWMFLCTALDCVNKFVIHL